MAYMAWFCFITVLTPSTVHLKVLIPSIAAGAVIGKDGEAIERIQKESGAKVKMSKRNDFYPECRDVYQEVELDIRIPIFTKTKQFVKSGEEPKQRFVSPDCIGNRLASE
ncbi:unnamed protein product [Taenia asiatica]|uniref:KH_dom_type_1 domain-containing protein n=1 Tax=Taenia asiatica TaxID=60517 RepID=A0A0R3VSK0_TAEAS|nr:unnamed protein product [Taenia asiatica]